MDLVTLITACTLNVEPKLMHALIWKQSGGEPWSFSVPGESLPRVLPALQDAVREAQVTRPEGAHSRRIDGAFDKSAVSESRHVRSVTFAARQLTQLIERCNRTSEPDPTYCAIAAYRGSWDMPDIGFANAVRAIVEEGSAPNIDLPKDAYFDATDIAFNLPTREAHAGLSTPESQSDDRSRGWSSALFPTKSTKTDGRSAGDRTAEEVRLSGPAAAVPDPSKAPIDNLFVPRTLERRPQ